MKGHRKKCRISKYFAGRKPCFIKMASKSVTLMPFFINAVHSQASFGMPISGCFVFTYQNLCPLMEKITFSSGLNLAMELIDISSHRQKDALVVRICLPRYDIFENSCPFYVSKRTFCLNTAIHMEHRSLLTCDPVPDLLHVFDSSSSRPSALYYVFPGVLQLFP